MPIDRRYTIIVIKKFCKQCFLVFFIFSNSLFLIMHQEGLLPVVSSYKGTQWFSPPNSNSMPLVRNKVASPFLPFLGHPFLYFILLAWSPDSKICDTFNFSMKLLVSLIKTFAHINKEKKKNIVLCLFIVFVFCFASTMSSKSTLRLKLSKK